MNELPIAAIVVPTSHRRVSPSRVDALAQSILEIGLQHPVGVTEDKRLIHGRHRLEAYISLGRTHIPAIVHKLDKLHAELAEIDENLERKSLTAVEEAKALARRKEIYEALHPETKRGAVGRRGSGKGETVSESDKLSFSDDTAAHTGTTSRTVERAVELGNKITDAAATQLHGTKVANNKAELKKLAALDEDEQLRVAKKIGDGKAKTVDQARGRGKCPVCAGAKWTEGKDDVTCQKCGHPHGEPAGDVDDDRLKTQRQKTVKTAEALMRAFDDLQCMKARKEHAKVIVDCKGLLKIAKGWM